MRASRWVFGGTSALFYGFLYVLLLIIILGAAWLGYGPGVLLCAISTLVLPHLMRSGTNRDTTGELSRFALVLIISLLVSRISETRRRTEAGSEPRTSRSPGSPRPRGPGESGSTTGSRSRNGRRSDAGKPSGRRKTSAATQSRRSGMMTVQA